MLYIFNYIFGKKLLRAYFVLFYYVPNQNKVFLSYFILYSDEILGRGLGRAQKYDWC